MTQANKLYQGDAEIIIPVGKKYVFQHDGNSKITDQNGFPIPDVGKSPGIINITSSLGFWAIDFQDDNETYTLADDVPVEVGIESPPDIMTRMRQMIAAEVMNKYGNDSQEVETLEEALDFDIDGDGQIGYSAAEIAAMDDEQLLDLGLVKTEQLDELKTAPVEPDGTTSEPPPEPTPV